MKKLLLLLLAVLVTFTKLAAQDSEQADRIYSQALELYKQQQLTAAAAEFEKVLTLNPRHKDALYNLAVLNYQFGSKDKAIELLQACVRLGDKEAAQMLKEQLHQKIAYADTMHYDVVDVAPKVLVNAVEEEALVEGGLNKVIEKSLVAELKKSKLLRKQVGQGRLLALSLYFSKDGSLNAIIVTPNKTDAAQQELTSVLQRVVRTIPGKHNGKEVVVGGLTLPVMM
ncbi:tetratricopeptide repeat protein [Pontibacter flavimaris]|uniref:Uncharacterized protein n=1 Tax=Pontibacter flavimaris TaxID=1797110 RepID=A0A1Q5PB08_9BACT|nr:tetratricopeptide repeat protein [Pontibacter flavimaris]OKL39408.1 hypothetical protein A3841_02255 [Pontibacter flavimaris]